jgi:RecB family endonuclease NucS
MTQTGAAAISRLRRVPLREVWRHEAYDFTTWLEHNTDVLSEVLGVVIENVERERAAGSSSVDLVGEDASGNSIVIENPLERSDHDHLGKLITYLAAFEASIAICRARRRLGPHPALGAHEARARRVD